MNHPFELDSPELEAMDFDFEETPSDALIAPITGATLFTTQAVGEEGGAIESISPPYPGSQAGGGIESISAPYPGSEGGGGGGFAHQPIFGPSMATQAMGEEERCKSTASCI